MAKTKKTKAPLDTKNEDQFWQTRARAEQPLVLHLSTGERVRGVVQFATEEVVGVADQGVTRLVSREELMYLEDPVPTSHE